MLGSVGDLILLELNTLYLTRFGTYKMARLPSLNKNLGGEGEIPAAKSLYRSIFKKSRHLGLESISYLVHGWLALTVQDGWCWLRVSWWLDPTQGTSGSPR